MILVKCAQDVEGNVLPEVESKAVKAFRQAGLARLSRQR